jgi:hypothetical protein
MRGPIPHWFLVLGFLALATSRAFAQEDEWHRVVTGAGFNIDIAVESLKLQADNRVSARFKTTLSKAEPIGGSSKTKYKTRIETIEFDTNSGQYRVLETSLLDESGKVALSSSSDQWKPIRGTAAELRNRALNLPPFGTWKVMTYRYADGRPPSASDPPELKALIGNYLWLNFSSVQLGGKSCQNPHFQLETVENDAFFNRTGSPLKAIGIDAIKVDAVLMKCSNDISGTKQTFFLQLPTGKLLLLWEGVFVELASPKGGWGSSLLRLITN